MNGPVIDSNKRRFTDEDLKRKELEAILEDTNTPSYTDRELEMMKMFARNSESPIPMEPLILKALLARLEVAERCCEYLKTFDLGKLHEGDRVQWTFPMEFYIAFKSALSAWRKAAGK